MSKIGVRCPQCNKHYEIDPKDLGKIGRCKRCQSRFRVRAGEGELVESGAEIMESSGALPSAPNQTKFSDSPAEPVSAVDPTATQIDTSRPDASETDSPLSRADTGTIPCEPPPAESTDPAARNSAEDDVPLEWSEGDVILDLYEVKQVHHGGGMGLVYRVHHKGWNLDLAVKSPRPESVDTEPKKAQFERECETWINLGLHPNTVSCYYVRRLGGIPRVFAEYVAGGDLKDWIEDGRLYEGGPEAALKRILDIAIQFAWGLKHAHDKGLVHQDIKPANVMMTAGGTAKVTDFGLAKAGGALVEGAAAPANRQVTFGGMTPAYCSPEQANRQKLSHKTDIWSWAVSVLEMFTGDVTWPSGVVAAEALEAYLETPTDDGSTAKMPEALAKLLRHCFQKAPVDRPPDMQAIADELKKSYCEVTGEDYSREEPKAAELLADGLNNRALSMLDLGKQDKAEELFDEALKADAHHPEATYNRGLMFWRSVRITDDALVGQLEEVCTSHPGEWRDEYLLGLVHLERGDYESAAEVLEAAAKQAPAEETVQAALRSARSSRIRSRPKVFEGHTDHVVSVCISPDGLFALSGSQDTTLRLWELATGHRLRTFEGHTGAVFSVTISPDGLFALSGSQDTALRLWELATGRCLLTFRGHTRDVTSVSISPDGRFALSGSDDKTLRLWELTMGSCLRTFQGHTRDVTSVSISPDGRLAVSGSDDKTLRLWELATGQCLQTFEGHTSNVTSVSISPDGRLAVSGSDDKTLRLWELATGKCLRTFQGHTADVTSVSITPDGRFALSGSSSGDRMLRLWELATGRCLRTLQHTSSIYCACISPDGRFALSGSFDKTLRLWELNRSLVASTAVAVPLNAIEVARASRAVQEALDAARRTLHARRPSEAMGELTRARQVRGYERDPRLLELWWAAGSLGAIRDLTGAWHLRAFQGHTNYVTSVCIGPDGRFALSGSGDKTLRLWELATGQCLRTFEGHTGNVNSVCISPDGRFALSGSDDNTLRLWELATGQCLRTFQGHRGYVTSVCISPDGRFALSGSDDESLRLWQLATGKCLRNFQGPTIRVKSVSISPDGRLALSRSKDRTPRLWELATGKCLRTFQGHTGFVSSVRISPDGRFALSGSEDKTLRLWELATGRCLRTFNGHTDHVYSVCISPDGRFALSGSSDKTLRLWELATGRCLRTFQGHTSWVSSVRISLDGQFGLSGSGDKTLRLWVLLWEYEFPEPTDWHEGARAYLENFLTLHCPYGDDGISRIGKPTWNDDNFQQLLKELQYRGYGWLRREGVRRQLENMINEWTGPPPLPGAAAAPILGDSTAPGDAGASFRGGDTNEKGTRPNRLFSSWLLLIPRLVTGLIRRLTPSTPRSHRKDFRPKAQCEVCGKTMGGLPVGTFMSPGPSAMREMLMSMRYLCPKCGFTSCFNCSADDSTQTVVCKRCGTRMEHV